MSEELSDTEKEHLIICSERMIKSITKQQPYAVIVDKFHYLSLSLSNNLDTIGNLEVLSMKNIIIVRDDSILGMNLLNATQYDNYLKRKALQDIAAGLKTLNETLKKERIYKR